MADADGDPVILEEHEAQAVIRLNRPAERNPLSVETLAQFEALVIALTARRDIQKIIFTGTNDVFASGANIREISGLERESALAFSERGQRLMQRIADATQLTIAAINGYCMGGGLDLALACRLRFASTNAVFAHPGARLGIITGWGGTQRLPRLVGAARALEFFTTARRLTSQEAYEAGLVDRICDPVLDCALDYFLKT